MFEISAFQNMIINSHDISLIADCCKSSKTPVCVTGIPHISKVQYAITLAKKLNKKILIITSDESTARYFVEDINNMLCDNQAIFFPTRDFVLYPSHSKSLEVEQDRLLALSRISKQDFTAVVASFEACSQFTIPKQVLEENSIEILPNADISPLKLTNILSLSGYERRDKLDGTSQFALRGGILDFFPAGSQKPIRIEFFGDSIDSINYFNLETQRREEKISSAVITPACETLYDKTDLCSKINSFKESLSKPNPTFISNLNLDLDKLSSGAYLSNIDKYIPLIYPDNSTLFDYLEDTLIFVNEPSDVISSFKANLAIANEDNKILLEDGIIIDGLDTFSLNFNDFIDKINTSTSIYLNNFTKTIPELKIASLVNSNCFSITNFSGKLDELFEDVYDYIQNDFAVVLLAGTPKATNTLIQDFKNASIHQKHFTVASFDENLSSLSNGVVYIGEGGLSSGFSYPNQKITLISHAKSRIKTSSSSKYKMANSKAISSLDDLLVGELVVHINHGIGRFEGIHQLTIDGIIKDYLKISYQSSDVLYVPVVQLDLVSRYIAPKDEANVKLNKLNTNEWKITRQKVKKCVADMAKELVKLYAKRTKAQGFAFSEDDELMKNFEERFDFEETFDQLRSINEIKADMHKPYPMDRLLCGDVGFGKTEVALRAAFKCVNDGKQCAILCPTTILANQHLTTTTKRFDSFPVNIGVLSRFRTKKQLLQTIEDTKNGKVDILIGTHRLIQKDVEFKNLGLCIIDEEQRFGVKHKESFKELCTGVDVLTLSATPIPRTLNMALSGVRDMSTIDTPPLDRHPVQTMVIEHDFDLIKQAIERELRRGGQVFYLHNRVDTIEYTKAKLSDLLPSANIAVAHGKMTEVQLFKIWQQLIDGKIDVLVCTTIIETGVDIPNANTLIIEDADNMGLSTLYQLRGRVGRSTRRAFCYLSFKPQKVLSEVATKRLNAIKEFTRFGSGFKIAMRDLSIRGAGNILGAQQHGHMVSVGYELYLKMLSDALMEEQLGSPVQTVECLIDIKVSAHIDTKYINALSDRIEIYKKIALVISQDDRVEIIDELIDRFSEPPKNVLNLIDISMVRKKASLLGITEIKQKKNTVFFSFASLDAQLVKPLIAIYKKNITINASSKPYIALELSSSDVMGEVCQLVSLIEKSSQEKA